MKEPIGNGPAALTWQGHKVFLFHGKMIFEFPRYTIDSTSTFITGVLVSLN